MSACVYLNSLEGAALKSVLGAWREAWPDSGANKGLYLVPVAVMIAGGAMGLRLVRRWARKPVPVTPAPAKAPAAEKVDSGEYDARINEELRGHDD